MSQTKSIVTYGLAGLDAYRVALAFYRLIAHRGLTGHLGSQLLDAAESIALNIGEAHSAVGADRARKFRIAANEASECGAALDLLEIRGALSASELSELRALIDRVRAMLYRLGRIR